MANRQYPHVNSCISHLVASQANSQGAFAVFVVIVAHFSLRKLARPATTIVLFHILSLLLDIAAFVYCFMHFPYDQCRNGSYSSASKGCKVDKAAVPLVGVLMYGLFRSQEADI